jgi:protein Tex
MNKEIIQIVASQLKIEQSRIIATLELLAEGATIPFIARYRKEKTNNLDEEQIKDIQTLHTSLEKLFERKEEVIRMIQEKGKLTPVLEQEIRLADTLKTVEDLYLPFKEKKKTRATIALANGLEPLANFLLQERNLPVEEEASKYLNETVPTIEDAIKGAKDILAERVSDDHQFREYARKSIMRYGKIVTSGKKVELDERKVYEGFYDYQEPIRLIANHRILAINRGENQDILKVKIETLDSDIVDYIYSKITDYKTTINTKHLKDVSEDSYKRLLFPSIEREMRNELTERAEKKAME